MPANREKPVIVPYIEHVPPDVMAGIFCLKNRDPQHWCDSQQLEHVFGKYIISDQPMTEEQWTRERATVIDAESAREELVIDLSRPKAPRVILFVTSATNKLTPLGWSGRPPPGCLLFTVQPSESAQLPAGRARPRNR